MLTTPRPKNLACYGTFHKVLDSALSFDTANAMARERETTGEMRGGYRILVGKPEGKRSLGRPRCGWEDNIKTAFHEVHWGKGIGCIDLAQDSNNSRVLLIP